MQARQILNKNDENAKGSFFIDNEQYYVSFPVINHDYDERGYSFESSPNWISNYGVRNNQGINCIVLHWDVCESVRDCFRTLCQRGLSAHLMIDWDGSVYQILDLIKLANHAKGCNHNSIGIMPQNPVNILRNDRNRPLTASREPDSNEPYSHLDFTNEQKEMVVKVCNDLCNIFPNIPRITDILSEEEKIGILAHYNTQHGRYGSLWEEFYNADYIIRN
ncbi:hypothetical protein RclHR1_07520015 [Rhizophagus clarus]|uniref:N-acetylmuramoyl-L-alanine amidase n=1 Tax=Rhizophagus clarus TaxID=94130 RepID=A0A2Z6RZ45_9GLOM|nr:hypothetical protein RclHR1_07520015 [Rhizophagus clarus]GES88749.1 N-acetylmuramoyl-L-alanine amidase [Rhizophagus clarus]